MLFLVNCCHAVANMDKMLEVGIMISLSFVCFACTLSLPHIILKSCHNVLCEKTNVKIGSCVSNLQ